MRPPSPPEREGPAATAIANGGLGGSITQCTDDDIGSLSARQAERLRRLYRLSHGWAGVIAPLAYGGVPR